MNMQSTAAGRALTSATMKGFHTITTGLAAGLNQMEKAIGGGKKSTDDEPAPPSVTRAYNVILAHVVAPLWSVGQQEDNEDLAGETDEVDYEGQNALLFARQLDDEGYDLSTIGQELLENEESTTVYLSFLLTRLLHIENTGDFEGITFVQTLQQLMATKRAHSGDITERHVMFNDETAVADQVNRPLTEMGGQWRSRGARDVHHTVHAERVRLLTCVMNATAHLRYYYTDVVLCAVVEALSSELLLVSYTENVLALCCGRKGANYLAKYMLFMSKSLRDGADGPYSEQNSLLTMVTTAVHLAVKEVIHRNDNGQLVVDAWCRAMVLVPQKSLTAALCLLRSTLSVVYCADVHLLHQLMTLVKPNLLLPMPVGKLAHIIMHELRRLISNINCLPRATLDWAYLGTVDTSYVRHPAFMLVNKTAARAYFMGEVFLGDVPATRPVGRTKQLPFPVYPVAQSVTPNNIHQPNFNDDAILAPANLLLNVFQAMVELEVEDSDRIDLGLLFTIPPHILAAYYPHVRNMLSTVDVFPSENLNDELFTIYHKLAQHGDQAFSRAHREESPWPPYASVIVRIVQENSVKDTLKECIESNEKLLSYKGQQDEPAGVHPGKQSSTTPPVALRLILGGGGSLIKAVATAISNLTLEQTVPEMNLYLLPMGYQNVLASWMESLDTLYSCFVFYPTINVPPSVQMPEDCPLSIQSALMRFSLDSYLRDARVRNSLKTFTVECYASLTAQPTVHTMTSQLEVGPHLNMQHSEQIMREFDDSRNVGQKMVDGVVGAFNELGNVMGLGGSSDKSGLLGKKVMDGKKELSAMEIMLHMHDQKCGMRLVTRRVSERELVKCTCNGSEILSWLKEQYSTDYQGAVRVAQKMVEWGLLRSLLGSSMRFNENGVYVADTTHVCDTSPQVTAPSIAVETSIAAKSAILQGKSSVVCRLRVSYESRRTDEVSYPELNAGVVREVSILTLSRGPDLETLEDITDEYLHLNIVDLEKRKKLRPAHDQRDTFTLNGTVVVESKHEFFASVDGEIVGPYVKIRVLPFDKQKNTELSIMSYTPLGNNSIVL